MCFPLSKSYVNYGSVIFFAVNKHLIKQMIKTTQKKTLRRKSKTNTTASEHMIGPLSLDWIGC